MTRTDSEALDDAINALTAAMDCCRWCEIEGACGDHYAQMDLLTRAVDAEATTDPA